MAAVRCRVVGGGFERWMEMRAWVCGLLSSGRSIIHPATEGVVLILSRWLWCGFRSGQVALFRDDGGEEGVRVCSFHPVPASPSPGSVSVSRPLFVFVSFDFTKESSKEHSFFFSSCGSKTIHNTKRAL